MFNFGFVVEHALGHITHYQNLKHWVAHDQAICPTWMPIEGGNNDIWARLPIVKANWSLQASLRARDAIRQTLQVQPIDALFLHTQTVALFALPLMRRIPTIISTDATPLNYDSIGAGYDHPVGGNAVMERLKFLWNRSTFHRATAIVVYCDWNKESLVVDYGISRDKVAVIPPGLDLEQWHFEREELNQPSGSQEPIRLLFVGGDFVRKGGRTLVEAFCTQLKRNCVLDVVTKDVKAAQDLAGVEGVRVHCDLTANSPRLRELYAKADIFLFPTQADCYPNAVMEAMAAGLPIVTTNVGAIHEQIEDGMNGWMVPPADVSSLIAAVNTLINDDSKRRSMAIASRRLAEERFDGRRNYGKILSLMKQLTEGKAEKETLSPSPLLHRP
jgi:glycosyltransferase involved in cell wall biosynthesis